MLSRIIEFTPKKQYGSIVTPPETTTWDAKKHPTGRWRHYDFKELVARDKASLDVFWLKDDALEASANLPPPHLIAAEIVEDLRAALEAFEGLEARLSQANADA